MFSLRVAAYASFENFVLKVDAMKRRVLPAVRVIALFGAICVICGLQGSVAALLAAGPSGSVVQDPQAVALLNQSLTAVTL
jgi:hypothetical protein